MDMFKLFKIDPCESLMNCMIHIDLLLGLKYNFYKKNGTANISILLHHKTHLHIHKFQKYLENKNKK